jgi:hypothetical protein
LNLYRAGRLGRFNRCRTSVGVKTFPAGMESLDRRLSA